MLNKELLHDYADQLIYEGNDEPVLCNKWWISKKGSLHLSKKAAGIGAFVIYVPRTSELYHVSDFLTHFVFNKNLHYKN